jgi:hypothetical protein
VRAFLASVERTLSRDETRRVARALLARECEREHEYARGTGFIPDTEEVGMRSLLIAIAACLALGACGVGGHIGPIGGGAHVGSR